MQVGPLPAETAGFVTFGCLDNFTKINQGVLQTWCELLAAVPNSRLLLHAAAGENRDRIARQFAERGIESARLTFNERLPMAKYFEQYHRIDIALDPFPSSAAARRVAMRCGWAFPW